MGRASEQLPRVPHAQPCFGRKTRSQDSEAHRNQQEPEKPNSDCGSQSRGSPDVGEPRSCRCSIEDGGTPNHARRFETGYPQKYGIAESFAPRRTFEKTQGLSFPLALARRIGVQPFDFPGISQQQQTRAASRELPAACPSCVVRREIFTAKKMSQE
jgi:hypothetical protein